MGGMAPMTSLRSLPLAFACRTSLALLPAIALAVGAVRAETVDIRQGTNLALALSPDHETLVVDLLGGLWQLPVSGGGAIALIPPGSGVAQPRFDRAGERIVFQRWLDGQWDLWLLTLADGEYRPLTETASDEREPEFSPDGREIVFAGNRGGTYAIWSLTLASGALRQLSDEPGDSRFPSFSESGELAFAHHLGNRSSIEVGRDGRRAIHLIESDRRLDAPSWRPGGGVVVYNERVEGASSDLGMYVEADLPIRRRLTEAEDVFVGRTAWLSPSEYLYAADGQIWRRAIASKERTPVHLFAGASVDSVANESVSGPLDAPGPHRVAGIDGLVRDPTTGRMAFSALGDLWLVDDGELQRLTDDAATDAWPDFSPDGEWLAFASDRSGSMQIWRLAIASGQLLQLTGESGRAYLPRISADGRYVGFLETAGFGPWDAARLRLTAIDRPFQSNVLASELYDAGELQWQGSRLRLLARNAGGGERLARVFDTPAGDLAATADASRPELDLSDSDWPRFTAAAADAPYVIQAGRLFDGVGGSYRYLLDIHVEGQRIRDVVRRGSLPLPARVIDAGELTVLPGLIDVHTHMSKLSGAEPGRLWLRHGVTTVREVLAETPAAIERAEIWASGRQPGPRLVIDPSIPAGEIAIPAGSPVIIGGARVARGLAHGIAEQRQRDGEYSPTLAPVLATGAIERRPGLNLSTLGRSYQDVIGELTASGAWLPTGLAALEMAGQRPGVGGLSTTIARVMRSSGRVAIGSDAPAVPYGAGFHDELSLLAAQGIPSDQILRWATAGGAIALGLSLDTGTIEPGRLADLVLVDGDPLRDVRELRRIVAVVRGGVWFDIDSLEATP